MRPLSSSYDSQGVTLSASETSRLVEGRSQPALVAKTRFFGGVIPVEAAE